MNDWYDVDDDSDDESFTMICPQCGESIFEDSVQCPNCREYLVGSTAAPMSSYMKWVVWLLVAALVLPAILAAINLL